MTQPSTARFFDLPLEIRNLIYEHVFCGTYPPHQSKEIFLSITISWRGYKCAVRHRPDYRHLFISRRFYEEALLIFCRDTTLRWSSPPVKDFNLNEMPSSRRKSFLFKDIVPRITAAQTTVSTNDSLPKHAISKPTIERMSALTTIDIEVTEPWYWIAPDNHLMPSDEMDWRGPNMVKVIPSFAVHEMTLPPYRHDDARDLQLALFRCSTLQRIAAAYFGRLGEFKDRAITPVITTFVRVICQDSERLQLMFEVKYDARTLNIISLLNVGFHKY